MRVRGLKLKTIHIKVIENTSHPMRVRGLKHHNHKGDYENPSVAPHAGAWIETGLKRDSVITRFESSVAPHAGAWIETLDAQIKKTKAESRTPCGCVD